MQPAVAETTASYDRIISALRDHGSHFAYDRSQKAKAQCPAHEDRTPSLAIDYKPHDRKTVIYCHTGCHPEDVVTALGLTLADLYDDPMPESKKTRRVLSRPRRLPRQATAPKKKAAKKKVPTCTGRFREVARYEYVSVDAEGQRVLSGEKIRRECTGCPTCAADGVKAEKRIVWRRAAPDGSYRWELPGEEWRMPENPPLYRAPELHAAPRGSTVYLGEGEKVVHAAEKLGLLATTKPGSAQTRWNGEHTPLLAGQHVVILADRDPAGYTCARDARDALLEDAASVSVLRTPLESKGADLDDHLAAGLDLDALEPVPESELVPDSTPAPGEDSGQPPATGDAQTDDGAEAGGEPVEGDDGRPNRRPEYVIRQGELVKVTRKVIGTDNGRPVYDTNFDVVLGCHARIVRVETRDVGDAEEHKPGHTPAESDVPAQQPTVGYVLELTHPKHLDRPVLMRVQRKDFIEGRWLDDLPWPDVYYSGTRTGIAQVCSAIRALSPDAVRVPVYSATGWRRLDDGRWMYVHAAGGITDAGHVPLHTRFPGRLSLMALPEPSTDPAVIRAAAMESLSLPAHLPEFAAVPLLGLTYRAPFGRCPSSICLTGLPGSGKTGVGTAVLHHFAPELERTEALLSISDTGSTQLGATEVLYRMKDALIMGDDSAPDRSVRDAQIRTSKLGRTQYNGEGRVRLKSVDGELELDEQRGPRGSFIQTAEVTASTQSAQERMFSLQMARAEIDLDALARVSGPETAQACARLMASYIQWIAARYETLHREVKTLADRYAAELRAYCGDRPAEHLGQFAAGWHMMLRYLTESGAATAEETHGWWGTAWSALLDAADRERTLLEGQTMHKRLLAYLASALTGKQAHLVGPDGKCPADLATALRYGWMVTDNSTGGPDTGGQPVLRAGGTQIGVVTLVDAQGPDGARTVEERLWLDHQQATRAALRIAAELGESFTVTANTLTEALRQAGVIEVEYENVKRGRWVKVRRSMPGGRRRVWDMPASAVMESEDDGGTGDGGAPRPPAPEPLFGLDALQPAPAPAVPAQAPSTEENTFAEAAEQPAAAPAPAPPSAPPAEPDPQEGAAPVMPGVTEVPEPAAVEEHQDAEELQEQAEDSTTAAAPTTFRRRRTGPSAEPWRAAVAVADVDGLYLPDGEIVPLPVDVDQLHAGHLAQMAGELGLGHGGSRRGTGPSARWRPDPGKIYIHDGLAEALELPDPYAVDEETFEYVPPREMLARHSDHPFLVRAREAGWDVDHFGQPTRIWREHEDGTRTSAMLEVTAWARAKGDTKFLADDPHPVLLAQRAQAVADTVGITYRTGPGSTGHDLLRAMRPTSGTGRAEPMTPAELPAVARENLKLYTARSFSRGLTTSGGLSALTEGEKSRRYLVALDARGSYLSVCGSLRIGRGPLTHLTDPDEIHDAMRKELPGYWIGTFPEWTWGGTFDLFGPRRPGQARAYVTPTLTYARQLDITPDITEAWVWKDHYRLLEPWYKQLRDGLAALPADGDPTVRATAKSIYTHGIGMFASPLLAGNTRKGIPDRDTFRPDVHHAVLAAQQANITRTILRAAERTGESGEPMWPVGLLTDCLYYATDTPDWETAVPGVRMGDGLGAFRPKGAARMADVLAHLEASPMHTILDGSLYTAPEAWSWQ